MRAIIIVTALLLQCSACTKPPAQPATEAVPTDTFVGSGQCADCHRGQFDAWQGSHHELAMQTASAETVLGDFDDAEFEYFGATSKFFKNNGKYYVRTAASNGELDEFEVTHTFGIYPLQQYLVDAPGGRRQSLPFTWDSRDTSEGGQRWYHMFPDDPVEPGDSLHWTGPYFNWNTMCAECHSTNLDVGYDVESNTYSTTFDEISVGCEACHGPGSQHIQRARTSTLFEHSGFEIDLDDRGGAAWIMNSSTGIAELSKATGRQLQPEACGRCHARRGVITGDYQYGRSLSDTHRPALLDEGLYHADGRILDEVYVYGSFLQSKMYQQGVTCSDCHEPHSATLRAGPDPDNTCAQCHLPSRFATDDHRGPAGGACVDCHMQSEIYMGVDARRDHSFRLPDATRDPQHYGHAIAAGRQGNANDQLSEAIVAGDFPPIVRATLLSLMEAPENEDQWQAIQAGFTDPDPLVRLGALRALQRIPAPRRNEAGSFLLRDPIRAVRIEAARVFLEQRDLLPLEDARAFGTALQEYRESLLVSASMPQSAVSLAELESSLGDDEAARRYYEHTLKIDANSALAQHAYGLFLVRSGDSAKALHHIRRAADLEPSNSRFVYVYAIALNSTGQSEQALELMQQAWSRFDGDPEIGFALATMYRDAGDRNAALAVVDRLLAANPDDEFAMRLRRSLSAD